MRLLPLVAALTVLALAAVCGISACRADAAVYSYADGHGHYVGERDATTNPVVSQVAAWGTYWLAAHGRRPCATELGGTIRMAPSLAGDDYPDVAGRALGCDVWIKTAEVAEANSFRVSDVWALCVDELHELAHTAGMSHQDMDSTGLELRWHSQCVGLSVRLHHRHISSTL